jgi:hypothetical protein
MQGYKAAKNWSVAKAAMLFALWVWAFWPEMYQIFLSAVHSSQSVHALVVPFAAVLLVYLRYPRHILDDLKGHSGGFILIVSGIVFYALTIWPFTFGYLHYIAIIPVFAGIILVTSGTAGLKVMMPVLLLIFLAIPLGARLYAALIIRPETVTIKAVGQILDMLPGVKCRVRGLDIVFSTAQKTSVVALGQSNRGARLLFAYAVVGVFVTFSRKRSLGRLFIVASTAIPVLLLVNLFRFLIWGLADIYMSAIPVSPTGMYLSTVVSLFLAYCIFLAINELKVRLFIEDNEDEIPENKQVNE